MYRISIKNKDDYNVIIDFLFSRCDRFEIVDSYPDVDYNSNFLNNLCEIHFDSEYVTEWCGTCIELETHSSPAKKYTFPFNKKALKILKKYSNYFELKESNGSKWYETFDEEEQLDIAFFCKDKCILYTIAHEGICLGEGDFLKELLRSNNISFEKWY